MRDFSAAPPRLSATGDDRPSTRRAGRAKSRPTVLARVFATRRLGFLFTVGLLALAGIGVPMNALFFQDGRHPSPLFTQAQAPVKSVAVETAKADAQKPDVAKRDAVKADSGVAPKPSSRAAAIETPRADPIAAAIETPRAAVKSAPAKIDSAKTGSVARETKKAAPPAKKQDAIGQLLGADAPRENAPDSRVLSAQQALLRLGYVVRANGVMSGGTRQAIEKFERDNGLAPTGKVTPTLLKKLAAQIGPARQ